MTKNKALHAWFNEFMPFYRASNVPDDAAFPYGTYEYTDGAWGDGEISIPTNLWFYTEGEAVPDEKVQQLSERIGSGGVIVPCDGGALWLKRGTPFGQSLDGGDGIKRRYVNVIVEYLTID